MRKHSKKVAVIALVMIIIISMVLAACSYIDPTYETGIDIPTFEEALADQPETKEDYTVITEKDLLNKVDDPFGNYYAVVIDNTEPHSSGVNEDGSSYVELNDWNIEYFDSYEMISSENFEELTLKLQDVDKAIVYGKAAAFGGVGTIYFYVTDIEF